jgi:hypothetical protein
LVAAMGCSAHRAPQVDRGAVGVPARRAWARGAPERATRVRRQNYPRLALGVMLIAVLVVGAVSAVPEPRQAGVAHAAALGAPGRPNVVVIMFDDLDVASLDKMLSLPSDVPGQDSLMPNLKRYVVDAGFTFTQSFVTNALCCPSRATFLTGKYTHNHGVYTNGAPTGGIVAFDDASTLATWLKEAGYRTGHVAST